MDEVIPKIRVISVGQDAKSVRIKVTPLTQGHVHQISLPGIKSADGQNLLHPIGYYTLNEIPRK